MLCTQEEKIMADANIVSFFVEDLSNRKMVKDIFNNW